MDSGRSMWTMSLHGSELIGTADRPSLEPDGHRFRSVEAAFASTGPRDHSPGSSIPRPAAASGSLPRPTVIPSRAFFWSSELLSTRGGPTRVALSLAFSRITTSVSIRASFATSGRAAPHRRASKTDWRRNECWRRSARRWTSAAGQRCERTRDRLHHPPVGRRGPRHAWRVHPGLRDSPRRTGRCRSLDGGARICCIHSRARSPDSPSTWPGSTRRRPICALPRKRSHRRPGTIVLHQSPCDDLDIGTTPGDAPIGGPGDALRRRRGRRAWAHRRDPAEYLGRPHVDDVLSPRTVHADILVRFVAHLFVCRASTLG